MSHLAAYYAHRDNWTRNCWNCDGPGSCRCDAITKRAAKRGARNYQRREMERAAAEDMDRVQVDMWIDAEIEDLEWAGLFFPPIPQQTDDEWWADAFAKMGWRAFHSKATLRRARTLEREWDRRGAGAR